MVWYSEQAKIYTRLAEKIAKNTESKVPSPLDIQDLRNWGKQCADSLLKQEI
ncbi:hypothetical protein JMF89_07590 [Clostridiaceae bacterium UIB06]|uniref:Uncharacterized protein n=1 Tax=Clostridium thailandense TaxID=2794346 RepID=A0A949TUF9_9CLOT|nr:hypothetical protein [Clostridium thailandense]MBV7273671.1 hypothetical protein [Clostridium thailandense]MCH5137063.1 hypothetical protein [Clostridiaceae bacterium UIB06]